ncbi:hypothetical protein BDW_01155 [Bdellovibrio bacteriovorus W]|nr:hypothetical protein BDW_01155 [Bdellovibrio bacteriovorus W]
MSFNTISEKEYRSFLQEIAELIELDPLNDSKEGERLKLISMAVQSYEKNKFFFAKPSPIDAIKFRMTEMGLSQTDLIPYLGGKNRVSEVLSKKRSLTLPMVKALNKYLEIPLDILIQEEKAKDVKFTPESFVFDEAVVKEIQKKGWIEKKPVDFDNIKGFIDSFLSPIGGLTPSNVLFRRAPHANIRGVNQTSTFLWASKVLLDSKKIESSTFSQTAIDNDFLKGIARLSYFKDGPLLAREELLKNGIKLVIVPHLTSTYIDGGTISDENGNPVVGLSLRYDRLDSFWHTLMHELVHIQKHLKVLVGPFLDDLDVEDPSDPIEREADQIAREIFIPKSVWRSSDALHFRTQESILLLAKELHISPAVIAGRIRFETKKYNLFSDLLGANTLRKIFGAA